MKFYADKARQAKSIFQTILTKNQEFFRTNSQFQDFYRPDFSFFSFSGLQANASAHGQQLEKKLVSASACTCMCSYTIHTKNIAPHYSQHELRKTILQGYYLTYVEYLNVSSNKM